MIDSLAKGTATFISGSFSTNGTVWLSVKNIALALLLTNSARIETWTLCCIFIFKTCIGFHWTNADRCWSLLYSQFILSNCSLFLIFIFLDLLNCLSVQWREPDYITVIISGLFFNSRASNCKCIACIVSTIALQDKSAMATTKTMDWCLGSLKLQWGSLQQLPHRATHQRLTLVSIHHFQK